MLRAYKTELDPNCSLCRKDKLAPQPYSDEVCWETVCSTHGQPMLVLNDHRPVPTPEEWEHIKRVKEERHPDKRFRGEGMKAMPGHFHEHLVGG